MVQVCFQYEWVTLGGTIQSEEECPPAPVSTAFSIVDMFFRVSGERGLDVDV